MAKIRRSFRSVYLFAILPPLVFGLFWALTGDLSKSAVVAAVVLAAVPFVVVSVLVWFLVPIAIHEAGHYVAGRREGFRFLVGVVGPFGWRREGERIVRFRHRPTVLGGYVAMFPTSGGDVERRFARFIAGGPLASLAWLGFVFVVWKLSGLPMSVQIPHRAGWAGLVQMGFVGLAWGAFWVLPGTLLPFRSKLLGGVPTDMLRLLTLRRGGDEARALLACIELNRMLLAGVPARELPRTLLDDAERSLAEDAQKLATLQMRWASELERDPEAAARTVVRLDALAEKLRPHLAQDWVDATELLQAEQASFVRRDADEAERRISGVAPAHPTLQAAKATIGAAIAALRHDLDLAEAIGRAETTIENAASRTSVSFDFERRWLAAMRDGWPHEPTRLNPAHPLEHQDDPARERDHQG